MSAISDVVYKQPLLSCKCNNMSPCVQHRNECPNTHKMLTQIVTETKRILTDKNLLLACVTQCILYNVAVYLQKKIARMSIFFCTK